MSAPVRDKVATGGIPALPRVNLIPTEIAERRTLRRVQAGMAGGGLAAVAIVVVLLLLAAASAAAAKHDLATAKAENVTVQGQVDSLKPVTQTFTLVDQARGALRNAAGGEILWSSYLTDLAQRIPDSVWLTKVSVAPAAVPAGATPGAPAGIASITFEGVALAHTDVAKWLDSVAKERGWSQAYFTKSDEKVLAGRLTYVFASTVTVTATALSGRYTKPAGS